MSKPFELSQALCLAPRLAQRRTWFVRFGFTVLAFNFFVVAWGAYVRASGSGAGCGRHWPKCNGEVVPTVKSAATFIEFAHRATSGLALVLVLALLVMARFLYPKGSSVRFFARLSAIFMVVEALLGAGLVLFEYVAKDASMKRALSMSLHLCNTFCLMGCIAATAYVAHRDISPRLSTRKLWPLLGMIPVGVSGAIAALGDTLFPHATLGEGLRADLGAGHIFLKLRALHPLFALGSAALLLAFLAVALRSQAAAEGSPLQRLAALAKGLMIGQILLGVINVLLLAPVPIQLTHLLLADAIFVALLLFILELLSGPEPHPQSQSPLSTT